MTGTVHDRAVAAELRRLAADEAVSLNWADETSAGMCVEEQTLLDRAAELEAAAPPLTIDATYTGDEPPIGTVLKSRNGAIWYRSPRQSDLHWFTVGSDDDWGDDWALVLKGAPLAVLDWPADD